jgi:hypothetical protein
MGGLMEQNFTHDEVVVLGMHCIMGFKKEEVSKFLGMPISSINRILKEANIKVHKVISTRLYNVKVYDDREKVAFLVSVRKGGVSTHDLKHYGIKKESLLSESVIQGLSEEDKYYAKRFGSSSKCIAKFNSKGSKRR